MDNINLDLIYGIPGENIKTLKKDLKLMVKLKPKHISTYSLQIEEHTKIYNEGINTIDEDLDSKMYFTIISVSNIEGVRSDLVRGITLRAGELCLLNDRFSELLAAHVNNDDESAMPMKLELLNKKMNLIVELNSSCRVVASREFLCELEDMGIDFAFDTALSAVPE